MSFPTSMGRMSSSNRTNRHQCGTSTTRISPGLCVLVSLGLMVAFLLVLAIHEWPDETQPLLDSRQSLVPGETCTQPLTLSKDGLYRLDVALTREGIVTGQMILHVTADSGGSEEIASAVAPVERAEDLSKEIRRPYTFVDFHFPSEKAILSGQVWLSLESQASALVEVRGVESDQSDFHFALKVYYRRTVIDNLVIFAARLKGRSICVGLLLLLYAVLLASLCVSISRVTFCRAASLEAGPIGKADMKAGGR